MSLRAQRDQKRRKNGCRERDEAGTETRGGQEHGIQPRVGGRRAQDGGGGCTETSGCSQCQSRVGSRHPKECGLGPEDSGEFTQDGGHTVIENSRALRASRRRKGTEGVSSS